MIVKPLTEHHLEFLGLKGGYTGSSESTLVEMSNCWKSHYVQLIYKPANMELKLRVPLKSTCRICFNTLY